MMKNIITDISKDPLGQMLLAYHSGNKEAEVHVESSTLEMSTMAGKVMFRSYHEMDELEQRALSLCNGNVLDVGAGSGCHTLPLQRLGINVTALDISPGAIDVLQMRGVEKTLHKNLFALSDITFDTILMLMNGIGMCGTLEGLNLFMQHVKSIMVPEGQIISDSTDLAPLLSDEFDNPFPGNRYYGETEFVMSFNEIESLPFPWLYIDFPLLETIANSNGFRCEKIMEGENGHYLFRLY